MQVVFNLDEEAREVVAEHVQDQLRWAFGSYSAEVSSVRVSFRTTRLGIECAIELELRGGRELTIEGLGQGFSDALRFAASRARSAVARMLGNERILGR